MVILGFKKYNSEGKRFFKKMTVTKTVITRTVTNSPTAGTPVTG